MFWDRAEEYTKTFLEEAASALAKAGAKVSDFDLGKPFEQFEAMGRRINDYEFSRGLTWERNHHWNLLSEFQRDKLAGWLNVSYEQYREAEAVLAQCRGHLAEAMKDIDLLLTPSALGEAPAGLTSTGDTSFNILSTWTYTPCVTLAGIYRTVRSASRHSADRSPKPGSPFVGRGAGCIPGVLEINMTSTAGKGWPKTFVPTVPVVQPLRSVQAVGTGTLLSLRVTGAVTALAGRQRCYLA